MDGSGGPFQPSVVRVGVNVHHSVESVSLEALIAARLGDGGEGGGTTQVRARFGLVWFGLVWFHEMR